MSRISIRKFAALAVLGASALFAGTAQAVQIDYNRVPTLGNSDFQFKTGYVYWYYGGESFQAELRGTLVLNDASGSCARMRLDYLYQGPIVDTTYGGEVCAPDGGKHEWTVDFDTKETSKIDNVKVSIETKTASHAYSPPQPPSDKVRLHASGFDFGDKYWSWITQQTGGSATMYWNRGDGAAYTPRLMGTLWLNDVAGVCARMHLAYKDQVGVRLADKYGGPACATGNDLQSWNIDLSPYTGTDISSVTVSIQTQQGSNAPWKDITGSSDTVHIDYDDLFNS
jgi:hypothetical protein